MNRQQKELVVQLFQDRFKQSSASFVVGYRGMTVNQLRELRTKLRSSGGTLKVAKARLMKRALHNVENAKGLLSHLHDQIGIVFVSQEPPAVAKILCDFAKEHQALSLVVGAFEGDVFSAQDIRRIALLPSRAQLLAMLCGTLNAPITRLVYVLASRLKQLAVVG